MKHQEHQETDTKTDEISSNNENRKKNTTMIEVRGKRLLRRKASSRKRTQCNEERAKQIQHAKRSIKPSLKSTSNSIEKMDSSKRTFEKRSVPEEDYRLFLSK